MEDKNQQAAQQPEKSESEIIKARRDNLNYFREKGIEPYKYSFGRTGSVEDIKKKHESTAEGAESAETESVAGRVMSIRAHGKTCFGHVKDQSGMIQIYVRKDEIGDENYEAFKKIDIGDIIGVSGKIFRTKTGELTVKAAAYELLTKSQLPLPEKWHGLTNKETRYRKRYLDLIVNDEVRAAFTVRTKVIKEIRNYLDRKGFMEVETPMMQAIPGGAKARPFITHHNTLDMDLYMRIAPELYLKRLLVGGFEKVYEINRNFRNEGISIKHNPEFTMLELYEAYTDFEGVMKICEEIVVTAADAVLGTRKINYQGTEINLDAPWRRLDMADAVREFAGTDPDKCELKEMEARLTGHGIKVRQGSTRGELMTLMFEEFVEAKLIQPVFITGFPVEVSPLSKVKRGNPAFVERFEPYIFGREIGNGFSELNDPDDQYERFKKQIETDTEGEVAKEIDEDYVEALRYGMPPAGGLGIGIDRLVMFFTDSASIRDVILFPLLRKE